jgi:hypothetical protein
MTVVLGELCESLPENFEHTVITVHQREGALKMVDELFNWRPASLANDDSLQEVFNED